METLSLVQLFLISYKGSMHTNYISTCRIHLQYTCTSTDRDYCICKVIPIETVVSCLNSQYLVQAVGLLEYFYLEVTNLSSLQNRNPLSWF